MSNVSSIRVNKTSYNVVKAPADKQQRLLELVGAKVALTSAAAEVATIDNNLLMGTLITSPDFKEIASIVLYKTIKDGGDKVVDVHDFQDNITEYYTLVIEAIKENIQDFFIYLDNVNKETRDARKGAEA